MVKQALGRGLGALLGVVPHAADSAPLTPAAAPSPEGVPAPADSSKPREVVLQAPTQQIRPSPLQPRKNFTPEAIQELADSIKSKGIIQPLVVRSRGDYFELIAGERRWRAAQSLNLETVPVIVRAADDLAVLELSLIENLQRENLNPIEEAMGYAELINLFNLTQEQAADKVGKNRATVANVVRLLNLPAEVQSWVREGRLSAGHAKVILSLPTGEEQLLAAERILRDNLNVRQAEELAAHWQSQRAAGPAKAKGGQNAPAIRDTHVVDMETRLREHFGTRVTLRYRQGKGSLEIRFHSNEELERILGIAGVKLD